MDLFLRSFEGVFHRAQVNEMEVLENRGPIVGVLVALDLNPEIVPAVVGEEGAEGFDLKGLGIADEVCGDVLQLPVEGLEAVEDDGGQKAEGPGEGLGDGGIGVEIDAGIHGRGLGEEGKGEGHGAGSSIRLGDCNMWRWGKGFCRSGSSTLHKWPTKVPECLRSGRLETRQFEQI